MIEMHRGVWDKSNSASGLNIGPILKKLQELIFIVNFSLCQNSQKI